MRSRWARVGRAGYEPESPAICHGPAFLLHPANVKRLKCMPRPELNCAQLPLKIYSQTASSILFTLPTYNLGHSSSIRIKKTVRTFLAMPLRSFTNPPPPRPVQDVEVNRWQLLVVAHRYFPNAVEEFMRDFGFIPEEERQAVRVRKEQISSKIASIP